MGSNKEKNFFMYVSRGQKTLGIDRPDELSKEDDEYEAYRKRMMLAYRFRPNPLVSTRMSGRETGRLLGASGPIPRVRIVRTKSVAVNVSTQ